MTHAQAHAAVNDLNLAGAETRPYPLNGRTSLGSEPGGAATTLLASRWGGAIKHKPAPALVNLTWRARRPAPTLWRWLGADVSVDWRCGLTLATGVTHA